MKSFAAAAAALVALVPSVMGLTVNTPLVGITTVACRRFADRNTGKVSPNANRSSLPGLVELHLTSCRSFLVCDLIPNLARTRLYPILQGPAKQPSVFIL
jgi:hypothetical protein